MLTLHFINVYPPQRKTSGLFHFAKQLASELASATTSTSRGGGREPAGASGGGTRAQGEEPRGHGPTPPTLTANGEQGEAIPSPRPSVARVSEFPLSDAKSWWNVLRTTSVDAVSSEVSVFQFSPHLFGRSELAQFALLLLLRRIQGLPTVLVWHDANAIKNPHLGKSATWSYSLLPPLVNATCVFSEHEAALFSSNTEVIPHFIRSRPRRDRLDARRALGLSEHSKIGGVLGFVHPRKGHDRTLGLLSPQGPLDELIFAGESNSDDYRRQLDDEVQRRGLANRVHLTGYLTEADFSLWANACDVGLCPFTDVSASGSLSDWLSLGRPVVAQDLPQLKFYADRAGSSVRLVDTARPEAFRDAVASALDADVGGQDLASLLDELSVSSVARQHATVAHDASERSRQTLAHRLRELASRISPITHSP